MIDALLSSPLLLLLLIPSFTSYSTSLNILFFTFTWSTLVLSHSSIRIEFFSVLIIRLLFYYLPSLVVLGFDTAVPSLAAQTKELGEDALAVNALASGGDAKKAARKIGKIAGWSLLNLLMGVVLQGGIEWLFTRVLHLRSVVRITTTLPFPLTMAKDLVKGFVLQEVLSYGIHRYVLHSANSPFSKQHQKWYHSINAPCSITAHYDHPLAYLLRVFLPTYIPAFVFRFHLLTYNVYLIIISLEELFTSSGYAYLPTGFILGGMARRTERHLITGGDGNFGMYGLLDLALGTSIGSDVVDDVRNEAENHNAGGRVRNKVNKAGKAMRNARRPRTRSSDENS